MRYLIFTLLISCGWLAKPNKPSPRFDSSVLQVRDKMVCERSKPIYESQNKTIEKQCDAALFTSLHGLMCDYVDPSVFELPDTGKLCRRPGCTCWDNQDAGNGETSDSGFSKDNAAGVQAYYSAFPDKALAVRVQDYGVKNNWTVCSAKDAVVLAGKCIMSPKIIYRWAEIEKKASRIELEGYENEPEEDQSILNLAKVDFKAHVQVVGIITEMNLYRGISNKSLQVIKDQAAREPNNLIYQAFNAKFIEKNEAEVRDMLLAKFPSDRLPTNEDWCTPYLYQRDEYLLGVKNPDWLPCEKKKTHTATEYLVASYILQWGE